MSTSPTPSVDSFGPEELPGCPGCGSVLLDEVLERRAVTCEGGIFSCPLPVKLALIDPGDGHPKAESAGALVATICKHCGHVFYFSMLAPKAKEDPDGD